MLVLGGGGMKGLAHVGAWKAVCECGVRVSEIIGTSIGSLVGACIAAGMEWEELAPRALALKKKDIVSLDGRALMVNGLRRESVFHDVAYREYIQRILPVERFDDLLLPMSMNAVDLETGRTEWFGVGGRTDLPLADAVYASSALPLFFPPARIGEQCYVDGGVRASLPVERAAERGADLIIAVDVSAGETKDTKDVLSKGMVAIHHRVYDIMAHAQRQAVLAAWSGPPLVHIRPRLEGYSTFDFDKTQYFLEEGYRATRKALANLATLGESMPPAEQRPPGRATAGA